MRAAFVKWAREALRRDPFLTVISGDYGYRAFEGFRPPRFYNLGPMEQAIIGIASGMSVGGRRVIVYGITPFLLERAFEQIKLDLDQMRRNVTLVCYDDYPRDGPTHRALDARVMVGMLPGTRLYDLGVPEEVPGAMCRALAGEGPCVVPLL